MNINEKFLNSLYKTFSIGKYRPGWVKNDDPEAEEVPVIKGQFTVLDGIDYSPIMGTYQTL